MVLKPGDVLFERYRIEVLLGQHGLEAVYRAIDSRSVGGQAVAIQEYRFGALPSTARSKATLQFEQGARLLHTLGHSNIPKVIEHFAVGEDRYLVTEWINGEDLQKRLARSGGQPLPLTDMLGWIDQVLDAVIYCHSRGVFHAGIKPSRIIITPDGRACLVGFLNMGHMETGAQKMEPGQAGSFLPPELLKKGLTVDRRADIYALGSTLYNLLTGQPPLDALERAGGARLATPCELNPAIPAHVEAAILLAMEMKPEERFESAAAFRNVFSGNSRGGLPVPVAAPPVQHMPVAITALPRRDLRWLWIVLGGLAIVAVGTILILTNARGKRTAAPVILPTQTHSSIPQPTATESGMYADIDGMRLITIPVGSFLMGSDDAGDPEYPQHSAYLEEYVIDQHEVTNAQYALCVEAGGCSEPHSDSSNKHAIYYTASVYADFPVINVDWFQAKAYCEWAGGSLPTEAQWEKAGRGTDGRLYAWGDQQPNVVLLNYNGTLSDTSAPCSFTSGNSPFGLCDVAGNVWEWVNDWYASDYYEQSPTNDPGGPEDGDYKVIRGGSWGSIAELVRIFDRESKRPDYWNNDLGFRCVR